MEDSILNKSLDWLDAIIQYQLKRFPSERLFFFLDEIQYIPEWSLLLKKYIDPYPQLKFVVTGSSSLFIKNQARESLAGRILETVMPPLSYGDFLQVAYNLTHPSIEEQKMYFNEFLCWGEFPYLNKLESWTDKKEYLLNWVISRLLKTTYQNSNALINQKNY
jgi:predicted AAA+ superfamily ATPase